MKVLVLGDPGGVGEALALRLRLLGGEADTVTGAQDAELAATLAEPEWTAIAVVTHDDALALRLTLLGAHLRPELPLWVTLFDRTIAHQLRQIVPSVNIVATAEVAAHELARHCAALIEHPRTGIFTGVRIVDDSLRLMVIAGFGLFAALVVTDCDHDDRAARRSRRRALLQHPFARDRHRRASIGLCGDLVQARRRSL